ncbi:LOW QUALITY PROTEIN: ZCWPW2 isoform 1, partial [Pongo abelii]
AFSAIKMRVKAKNLPQMSRKILGIINAEVKRINTGEKRGEEKQISKNNIEKKKPKFRKRKRKAILKCSFENVCSDDALSKENMVVSETEVLLKELEQMLQQALQPTATPDESEEGHGEEINMGEKTIFFFGNKVSLCHQGWSEVMRSLLTAISASQVQVILLPQPPEYVGLQNNNHRRFMVEDQEKLCLS